METITIFAWFKYHEGSLSGLKEMPGLPKAARFMFNHYIADIQFSSPEMDFISGIALQFNDQNIAETILDKIRRIAMDYDMVPVFKFCTEDSKIDWMMTMGIEDKPLYSPNRPVDFETIELNKPIKLVGVECLTSLEQENDESNTTSPWAIKSITNIIKTVFGLPGTQQHQFDDAEKDAKKNDN